MLKDTARIIMFLECNFKCRYCCNEQDQFNSLFVEKHLAEIDFDAYQNICVSGGEPFLRKDVLYNVLERIPRQKPIYLYTNGILITDDDIEKLQAYNIQGINVGIHGVNQVRFVNPGIERRFSVRYLAQDKNSEKLLAMYPGRVTPQNAKFWKLDDCYRENEDWILLKDYGL